jgi:hypothetical protein
MARGPLAGASGPGKFSARTDGLQLGSIAYGEGQETQAIKSGAPMAKTADVRGMPAAEVRNAAAQAPITPLYAPSQRADEPVTTGIALGPGAGPEIMGGQPSSERLSDVLARMLPYDVDGEIAILYQQAVARGL